MMLGGVFSLLSIIFLFSPTNGGLNQLCELIDFYDKAKHTAECITYDNYGCWCGSGGSGKPVDATDRCCQRHDFCYDRILQKNECSPYLHQYEHSNGTCYDPAGTCPYNTCECDRKLAMCLSKSPYEWRYWGHRLWPGNC
ncbi:basic phospholipase A2 nigroxin B-like [Hydractinia symbiolongicarpus]|uniref:basic phospholipase A2 nigroxin B-like n=1 Tax=Hydractinia symbiolongicarpus TaxID=13093 RepID=UPI00254A5CE9|nr:basic phospholipase A2 nigroxin B-like [Hydractinia symbiolongicarpus]